MNQRILLGVAIACAMAWSAATVAAEPSISLELRQIAPPRPAAPKAGADPALESLMVKAIPDRMMNVVTVSVVVRAHRDVLVNKAHVHIEIRDPSGDRLPSRGKHPCPDIDVWREEGDVRLRSGETAATQVRFHPGCYRLRPGANYSVIAAFEDHGDPLRASPPPGIMVAMKRVESNRVVLTYRGEETGRVQPDLEIVGTVTKIVLRKGDDSHEPWAVTVRVDRIISGALPESTFTFALHSPGRAGLKVGKSCRMKAAWTAKGYVVNEAPFRCL